MSHPSAIMNGVIGGVGGGGPSQTGAHETKVIYYLDDEETPYSVKLPTPPELVTLKDFKSLISLPKTNYKFFFKSYDEIEGIVKQEVMEDDMKLPFFRGRVVAFIVSSDDSNASDGSTSQVTEISGRPNHHHHHPSHSNHGSLRRVQNGFSGHHRNQHTGHHNGHTIYGGFGADDNCDDSTTGSESCISSRFDDRRNRRYRGHGRQPCDRYHYDSSSCMTSEVDTSSFLDSDEDDEDESASRISTTTADTSVSRMNDARHRRRRRRRMPEMDNSSVSSVTDSSVSLNVIDIVLTMDTVNFLGISLVGQQDGAIYVGTIMPGGAVALDGRIENGDLLLKVNDVSFSNLTNQQAVELLRDAVKKPGPIRLSVAKMWDPNPKGYFTPPGGKKLPIDPGAWVAHTEAQLQAAREAGELLRPPSVATMTSTSSSMTSVGDSQHLLMDKAVLSLDMDMLTITKAMATFDSGLDVRDRLWLKIKIPDAFLGSDVVDWLFSHVQGFPERKDAKKYANHMLKQKYLKHTINKNSFTEQCYYVFGDCILGCASAVARLRLDDGPGGDGVSESDTLIGSGSSQHSSSSPWHGNHHQIAPFEGLPPSFLSGVGENTAVPYGMFGGPSRNGVDGPIGAGTSSTSNGPPHLMGLSSRTSGSGSSEAPSQLSGPHPRVGFPPQPTYVNDSQHHYQEPVYQPPGSMEHTVRPIMVDPHSQDASGGFKGNNSMRGNKDHHHHHNDSEDEDEDHLVVEYAEYSNDLM